MSKIFLCHASEDKKFVEKLAKDLMRFGFEVWFDKFEMVKHEIQSAFAKKFKDENFKILPVLYEECDVPLYLAGLLYADFPTIMKKDFKIFSTFSA